MWRLANYLFRRPTALLLDWTPVRTMARNEFVVPPCEVVRFCEEALVCAGACPANAKETAHVLAAADYYGRSTHGILRLGYYINELASGQVSGQARPCLIKETAATACVDGNNGMGAVVANFCNQIALQKATECGIGYVAARHSNHFGIASYYTRYVAGCGMIGIAMSVSSPLVVAAGSKQTMLGTNPISIAAPGCDGDSFVFDGSTSNASIGKIQEYGQMKKKLPSDWALGKKFSPITDPAAAMAHKKLLPLGGLTSGYKGYGLALAVDILSSVLSGALSGPDIPDAYPTDEETKAAKKKKKKGKEQQEEEEKPRHACLGMSFLALDPKAFGDGFQARVTMLLKMLRCAEPLDPKCPVRVPGDFSKQFAAFCDCRGGVPYLPHHREAMEEIAKRFKIKPMQNRA